MTIRYSERYDAYYDEESNQWTESKCDDPTCEFCSVRPDRPLPPDMEKWMKENVKWVEKAYQISLEKGAEEIRRYIDQEALRKLNLLKEPSDVHETPFEIGQRMYRNGWGVSDLWSAVQKDEDLEEAFRGYRSELEKTEGTSGA